MRIYWFIGGMFIALLSVGVQAFELVYVQSISASRKSFVTRTGKAKGIVDGHLATFTSKDASIVAKAQSVTREFTVWKVRDPFVSMPFQKNQIVEYNASLESIYANLRTKEKEVNQKEWTDKEHFLQGRFHFGTTFSETTSEVEEITDPRVVNHYEGLYLYQFARYLWGGVGGRIDYESVAATDYDLLTTRFLVTLELAMIFPRFRPINARLYIAAGAGVGQSSTEVSTEISTGISYLLPYGRAGLLFPLGQTSTGLLIEGSVESVHSDEEYSDGTTQTTNLTTGKIGVGLSFTL